MTETTKVFLIANDLTIFRCISCKLVWSLTTNKTRMPRGFRDCPRCVGIRKNPGQILRILEDKKEVFANE